MEFLRSLLRRRFARAQVATSRNVGCFLRLLRMCHGTEEFSIKGCFRDILSVQARKSANLEKKSRIALYACSTYYKNDMS